MNKKFAFNAFYIVDILGDKDLLSPDEIAVDNNNGKIIKLQNNTASQLFESISSLRLSIPIVYVKIHNLPMIYSFFKDLEKKAKHDNLIPILHFECHGSSGEGIYLPSIRKNLSWHELSVLLIKINKNTYNNTLVVFAGCETFNLINNIDYKNGSPFGCYIGSKSVTYDGIIKRFKDFYRSIFLYNDLNFAYSVIQDDFSLIFSCDLCLSKILLPIVLNYFGKDRKDLIEYTINQLIKNGQKGPISHIRKIAKHRIAHLDKYYEISSKRFLHGNNPLPFSEAKRIALHVKTSLSREAKFNDELKKAIFLKKQLAIGKLDT
ncbi:hypothetical protein [Pectobacterium versatile]|uniref:hypothetical protein n=1 Tax=Pectobacterium versatile TaxID=2488639 RepID=UPI0038123624